jgi:glycosyltransferase involved in cell wall biosynthesis
VLTLSVISPAYNSEDAITGYLESIIAQTWPEFEFIIIDDASIDRTAAVIENYLPRIQNRSSIYIRHDKNIGEGATVAEAFSKTTGDIILKMDSDSVFEPDTFIKIMDTFNTEEQVGVVTAPLSARDRTNWIVRGTEVYYIVYQRIALGKPENFEHAFGTCFAFRRFLFAEQDLRSRTDVDLSWLARERGWKIVLRNDIFFQTRFPSTLPWLFERGRREARQVWINYRHHANKLQTRWLFLIKFTPLCLVILALFRPIWALLGLLGWMVLLQIVLMRLASDYPISDRLAVWVVNLVGWSGFDIEMISKMVRIVVDRFK